MNHHALINEQRERSLVLHRLAESIAARPFLLAALTLYWTWAVSYTHLTLPTN